MGKFTQLIGPLVANNGARPAAALCEEATPAVCAFTRRLVEGLEQKRCVGPAALQRRDAHTGADLVCLQMPSDPDI